MESSFQKKNNRFNEFLETGNYEVCLNIETEGFCKDAYCENIFITSIKPCSVDFKVVLNKENLNIVFVDMSEVSEDDKIISWNWSFGDGNTSTEQNPINEYEQKDIYIICLEIETELGCKEKKCNMVGISIKQCKIDFILFFNGLNISINSASIWYGEPTFLWDFGDGSEIKEGYEVSHTYLQGGSYEICHTLQTDEGCDEKICKNIFLDFYDVDCNFTYEIANLSVKLYTNYFPDVEHKFDFGDGTISANPNHTYKEEGTYNICVSQTHEINENTCRKCIDIVIENTDYCKAKYEILHFDDNIHVFLDKSKSSSNIIERKWHFDNLLGVSGKSVINHYLKEGDSWVILEIETESGCKSNTLLNNSFLKSKDVECTVQIDHHLDGLIGGFKDISITDSEINSYLWTIDGKEYEDKDITHQFSAPGVYEVCHSIKTVDGCEDAYCQAFSVGIDLDCRADFTYTIDGLNFTVKDVSESMDEITKYQWVFGDGTKSTQKDFTHSFLQSDIYTICLNIETENDCTDFICKEITIGSVGIEDNKNALPEGIRIFPSPAKDKISIDNQSSFSFKVILFDSTGRRIEKEKLRKQEKLLLDTKLMPNGLYMVQLENEKGEQWTKQIVVQH